MRTLVVGCGYVGAALLPHLVAAGHAVSTLRRSAPPASERHQGVQSIQGDVLCTADLERIPGEIDAVVYTVSASQGDEAGYRRAYVEGVSALGELFAGRRDPLPRFLFASSTSVYGQSEGEWVDESSPTEPANFRGATLLEGEGQLANFGPGSSALRLGGIYGPGRDRLLRGVADGNVGLPETRPKFTNRIHREDAARAFAHLLDRAEIHPRYVVVDDDPADLHEVVSWLADALEVSPREAPRDRDPRTRGGGHKRCSNARLKEAGFRCLYPSFREGYGEMLAGLRAD